MIRLYVPELSISALLTFVIYHFAFGKTQKIKTIFFFNSLKNKVKARFCEPQTTQSYLPYVHGCDCFSGVVRLDGEEGYCGRDSRDWLTSELAVSGFSGGGTGEKRGES